jgi:hypothetical protein
MSSGRFYFYRDGQELTDHPLNGSAFDGTGQYVDQSIQPQHRRTPADKARHSITAFAGKGKTREITAEDFGGVAVLVKLWWPKPDMRDSFYLIPKAE